jgi:hypothetical protein
MMTGSDSRPNRNRSSVIEHILTPDLFRELRLDGGWMLRNVYIHRAGTEVIINASLDWNSPDTSQFQLVFRNCRYTSWDVIAEDYFETDGYSVSGCDLYDNPEGKEAVIRVDEFELMITYGELVFQYEE